MNVATSFPAMDDDLEWASAMLELNAWRGRWLQSFTGAENAIADTLVALRGLPGCEVTVRLRHLSGARTEDLAELVGEGGMFAEPGKQVAKALAAFRVHEKLRNMLAHGHAKIAMERTGEWLAVFRMTAVRGQHWERLEFVVEQAEAARMTKEIHRAGQSLTAHLANLQKALCAQSIGT